MGDEIARATYKERRAMEDLMMRHSMPVPNADGKHIRKWNEGWNAEHVAQEVNPRFSAAHMTAIQRELDISFRAVKAPTGEVSRVEFEEFKAAMLQRLKELEDEVFDPQPIATKKK